MLTLLTKITQRIRNIFYPRKMLKLQTHDNLNQQMSQLQEQISSAWLLPPPDFDEERYLRENTDLHEFVETGRFASGYDHYMKYGRHEGRHRPIRHL